MLKGKDYVPCQKVLAQGFLRHNFYSVINVKFRPFEKSDAGRIIKPFLL